MDQKISKIKKEYKELVKKANTLRGMDVVYLAMFGRNGKFTQLTEQFPSLSKEELKKIAPLFNKLKDEVERDIEQHRNKIREAFYQKLNNESFDLEKAAVKKRKGHLHLSTQFKKEVIDLFAKLGFSQFDAPHVEWDKYNFQDLNMPKDHPARDMQDTLYIDTGSLREARNLKLEPGSLLLRTHTSNFWPRLMEKHKLPIRAMSFDRCFRYEALDARHSHTFNQFEIAVVSSTNVVGEAGEEISMANLKYLSDYLLQGLLGKEAKSRFRPKYYPFVEPGVGIDCLCVFCHGKGCKICSNTGWFEIAGAGLIHPNVFKATGLDPKKYTGLAWGFGPDRMLMIKYQIDDIRYFLEGDLKFLQGRTFAKVRP